MGRRRGRELLALQRGVRGDGMPGGSIVRQRRFDLVHAYRKRVNADRRLNLSRFALLLFGMAIVGYRQVLSRMWLVIAVRNRPGCRSMFLGEIDASLPWEGRRLCCVRPCLLAAW